jgi:hypothetical protein
MPFVKTLKFFSGNLHAFSCSFSMLTIETDSKKNVVIKGVDSEIWAFRRGNSLGIKGTSNEWNKGGLIELL